MIALMGSSFDLLFSLKDVTELDSYTLIKLLTC